MCHAGSVKCFARNLGWLTFATVAAYGQIGGLKPAVGTMAEGKIVVAQGIDAATEIPITVIRGGKPGPTLAIIAGFSGTEYAPILATKQAAGNLKAAELSGTLVLVHIANLPAFESRAVYLNPIDHKDLTRAFPGKADGSSSERIAYALMTQVIEKADAVLVLEAGGSNMGLAPHVYQGVSGDAKLDAKMASMAMAFGINYIVVDKGMKSSKGTPEGEALASGKAVLKVVSGSFGMADNRTVDGLGKGIASILNLLEMMPGAPVKTRLPVFFDRTVPIESPQTGVLLVYAGRGDNVHKGDPLFGIAGYVGKTSQTVKAPNDGIVIYSMTAPPVKKGEVVTLIGVPREQ